jgi:tRNA-2-methylthio-N6-dimethylallyladenosine synthase
VNTYKIVTYGCQMNAYDSELLAGILEARGLRRVEEDSEADVLLVNTCVVRGSAESRAMGRIDAMKRLKDENPERIIGICGCMAQRDGLSLVERAPHIDLVMGTHALSSLSAFLDRIRAGDGPVVCTNESDNPYETDAVPIRKSDLRALVPIMVGCNNWCSYCIVPVVRGRERSRPIDTIVDEVRALVDGGCREVTLVGQNVNSYHDGDVDFAGVLERVSAIEGLWRIRYTTSHPRDANARHLDAVERSDKVCDHFHLPVQAGSDRVLERMNRGYTREHYFALVREIRRRMPDAAITSDLMVGFPGETEEDYRQTLDLVETVRFDAAFTFLYNVREGTRAAEWPDDVPLDTKKDRLARLIRMQEGIQRERNEEWVGRTVEVLVEGRARRNDRDGCAAHLLGRTTGDKCVIFEGAESDIATRVRVRIVHVSAHTLFGERD